MCVLTANSESRPYNAQRNCKKQRVVKLICLVLSKKKMPMKPVKLLQFFSSFKIHCLKQVPSTH